MSKKKITKFDRLYYQASKPGAYGGKSSFLRQFSSKDKNKAEQWLMTQDAYNAHVPFKKNFTRRRTIANFEQQIQVDLVDLNQIAKHNDKYRYLLTAIDVFSKKAYLEILRKKNTQTVADAFEKILDRLGFKPELVHSDQGSEFIGGAFQNLLKQRGIKYFSTTDASIKCGVIERFHRSLLSKLYRYFTKNNSLRYVEILQDIIQSYNNTIHSSTGLAPNRVSHLNKELVWQRLFAPKKIQTPAKSSQLKVGTFVKIAKRIKTFEKGYKSKWSGEVFKIHKIKQTTPKTYILKDQLDETILGAFYAQELSPVPLPNAFPIESVLDSKRGKILVKWRDYPSKFNSWVSKKVY